MTQEATFIATLGTEPQVVTTTLQLLAQKGLRFANVVVIHTAPNHPGIIAAIETVERELEAKFKRAGLIQQFSMVLLKGADGTPISDLHTEADAGAVFTAIYKAIKDQKRAHRQIHLNVSGGRKGMTAYGMATAQLLFEEGDCVWLLVSSQSFTISRELYPAQEGEAHVLRVLVLRYSGLPTTVTALLNYDDPMEAVRQQDRFVQDQSIQARRSFLFSLAQEQRAVLEQVARAKSDKEAAAALGKSEKTVGNYLGIIYRRISESGLVPKNTPINRQTLIQLFGPLI